MRNQNIYTARITQGLVVGALGNSRRLGAIQRSFPVFAQNNRTTIRSFRLTITNQPVGGQASFKQFAPLTTLDVRVPRKSTVARTVFARSSDPHAPINVSVVEIAAPGGAPVPNGQQGTIVLNPDPTTPDLENPDLENPDLENPDLENAEVHNPDLENATVRNPDLENPDLENPDLENPDLENTTVVNTSILNPDLENPDLENPDLENPDLENPDLENVDLDEWRAQRHDVDGHEQGQHGGLVYRQAGAQSPAPGRLQEPASRAQDLPDAGHAGMLALETVADGPPRQHSKPQVRGHWRAGESRP